MKFPYNCILGMIDKHVISVSHATPEAKDGKETKETKAKKKK
jgi:hypothetical protein